MGVATNVYLGGFVSRYALNHIANKVHKMQFVGVGMSLCATLLGMGEDFWPLVCNDLHKDLGQWCDGYANIFGGYDHFYQIKQSLLVDHVSMWMTVPDMWYVIASRYNVVFILLSLKQNINFFPLRIQPHKDSFMHRIICIGHVNVHLTDRCPIPGLHVLWSTHCHPPAKEWVTS
ncbi:hypothetical protein HKD37_01G000665 [Glycine soja]